MKANTPWWTRALCAKLADFDPDDYAESRAVCMACPVRTDCLDAAMAEERGLSVSFRAGIRGGLGPYERAARKGEPVCPDCRQRPLDGKSHTCAPCRHARKLTRQRRHDDRIRRENALYNTDQARLAHNAYMRGERGAWVETGERVYQRRKKNRLRMRDRGAA